jgi:hypothetical protein
MTIWKGGGPAGRHADRGPCRQNSAPQLAAGSQLEIVGHLSDWLKTRLGGDTFENDLAHAVLTVAISTDRVATDRSRVIPFDWVCDSSIASRDSTTRTGTGSGLTWYDRDKR